MNDWLRGLGGTAIALGVGGAVFDLTNTEITWQIGIIVAIVGIFVGSVGEYRDQTQQKRAWENKVKFDQPWKQ